MAPLLHHLTRPGTSWARPGSPSPAHTRGLPQGHCAQVYRALPAAWRRAVHSHCWRPCEAGEAGPGSTYDVLIPMQVKATLGHTHHAHSRVNHLPFPFWAVPTTLAIFLGPGDQQSRLSWVQRPAKPSQATAPAQGRAGSLPLRGCAPHKNGPRPQEGRPQALLFRAVSWRVHSPAHISSPPQTGRVPAALPPY